MKIIYNNSFPGLPFEIPEYIHQLIVGKMMKKKGSGDHIKLRGTEFVCQNIHAHNSYITFMQQVLIGKGNDIWVGINAC